MSSSKPIGGYFELELYPAADGGFLHDDAVLVGSGRGGFEYILRSHHVSRVYMPKYTCDVMLEPLEKLGIPHEFYKINEALEIDGDITLADDEYVVYTNYFGVKDTYCQKLYDTYHDKVIFDYSQAFYSPRIGRAHTFYSPRKFFGLPDGGMAYTDAELGEPLPDGQSYDHFLHLLKRIDAGAEAGYKDFQQNDAALSDLPLTQMSELTRRLLAATHFDAARTKRLENFAVLDEALGGGNQLKPDTNSLTVPMVYPYVSDDPGLRQKLIENKIFVATYWPNVFDWCKEDELEYKLAQTILPLPIDQRYGLGDMKRILEVIHG